jgi:copper homeostasis protein
VISAACERSPLPVVVLARPRPGDFVYSDLEVDLVTRDLEHLNNSGARGAAIGALTRDGDVDLAALDAWERAKGDLELVFHRAFDSCRAPLETLSLLADHGVQRVLTSGAAPTAAEGAENLADWIEALGDRIEILPAGTIRAENVAALIEKTKADQVHFRAPAPRDAAEARLALGPLDTGHHEVTDAEVVRAVRDALS